MISDKDTFSAQYVFGKANDPSYVGDSIKYTFNIIPATTVYYEDSFVDFYDAGSSAKKTEFTKTGASDEMGVWYVGRRKHHRRAGTQQAWRQSYLRLR